MNPTSSERFARPTTRVSVFLLSACLALATPLVHAGSADDDDARILEEVIVTATYRETNLMDTPQAISAITDSLVEDLGAQAMEDIFTMVPGLGMQGSSDGENRYTIRGITSQTGDVGYFLTSAVVGVYLDGTPVTAALGPDNQVSGTLFDIDRVEVLKGPQGTLFGEGSMAGTIRFLYKQPDPTQFDAAVNVGYGEMAESDDNSTRLDAMVNIPFGDGFALRVTAWDAETAGFIEDVDPAGGILAQDWNTAGRSGVRAALRYEADKFAIAGTIYSSTQETAGSVQTRRAFETSAPSIPGHPPESADEIDIYSLVVEVDLSWANFESMTSFTERSITSTSLGGYQGLWLLDFVYGGSTLAADHPGCTPEISLGFCPGFPGFFNLALPVVTPDGMNLQAIAGFIDSYSERWVQEFRLVSPGDRRLRWTAGAFWKDSEDHSQNNQVASYFPGREIFGVFLDPLLTGLAANVHTDLLEEYAVFGEVSYDLTDRLEVTVGLRYSDMEQYFSNTDSGTDDSPVSPKFVLSWRPTDDLLLYFNYATGFRPGNVNNHMSFNHRQLEIQIQAAEAAGGSPFIPILRQAQQVSLSHRFFGGDDVESYELGLKTTLWDGRVRILASAYRIDWNDMIVIEAEPFLAALTPGTETYNTNSGGAEVQGFELEVGALVTERLYVRFAADAKNTEVVRAPEFSTYSGEGNEMMFAPNQTASLAVDYTLPLARGWTAVLHADRAWVDEQFADSPNLRVLPSYRKTNARVTLRSGDDKWRIAGFVTNVDNYQILRGRSTYLDTPLFWFPPRQIGIEVGYSM